jgi:hypothetical protein
MAALRQRHMRTYALVKGGCPHLLRSHGRSLVEESYSAL